MSIPTYSGQIHFSIVNSLLSAGNSARPLNVQFASSSLLTKCFNQLWCEALNAREKGITHFLMLHADIAIGTPQWLDRMHELMDAHSADVLSVVSPLKSPDGYTSTAVQTDDYFRPKKFTMREIHTMAATFTTPKLLINTGLMLVDMRKPWVEHMSFDFENAIERTEHGYEAVAMSEDWLFSIEAAGLGARIFATREIAIEHMGSAAYPNYKPWGTQA